MNLPPNIQSKLNNFTRRKGYSEVENIYVKELVYKLAKIRAEIIKGIIKEQLKVAA